MPGSFFITIDNMKILKTVSLLSALLSGDVLAASPECFADADAYMIATYGENFRDDDMLVITKKIYGKQTFFVASDKTPGTNVARTLLMKKNRRGLCRVLATPPVAELRASSFDKLGFPRQFFVADQGNPSREITYFWNSNRAIYNAKECKEISWTGPRRVKKLVSCEAIVD